MCERIPVTVLKPVTTSNLYMIITNMTVFHFNLVEAAPGSLPLKNFAVAVLNTYLMLIQTKLHNSNS